MVWLVKWKVKPPSADASQQAHHESQHGWPDDDAWPLAWGPAANEGGQLVNTPQPTSPRRIPKHQHSIGTFNYGPEAEGALRLECGISLRDAYTVDKYQLLRPPKQHC